MEVVEDIEIRTSELLQESFADSGNVVSYQDVEAVIARIGKPADMIDDYIEIEVEGEPVSGPGNASATDTEIKVEEKSSNEIPLPPPLPEVPQVKRRLFRDTTNSLIGGVCAGLAKYINVDVVWIRLVFVIMLFLSMTTDYFFSTFSLCLAYLAMWIIIPPARTPLQKLQMNGQSPTLQNISNYFTGKGNVDLAQADEEPQSTLITRIIKILVKVAVIVFLVIAIPSVAVGVIAMLGCLAVLIAWACLPLFNPGSITELTFIGELPTHDIGAILCMFAVILLASVLLFAGIYMVLKGKDATMKKKVWLPLLVLVIISVIVCTAGFITLSIYPA